MADVSRLQSEFATELVFPICELPSADGSLSSIWIGRRENPASAETDDSPSSDFIDYLDLWSGIEVFPSLAAPRAEEVPVWESPLAGIPVNNATAGVGGLDSSLWLMRQTDGSYVWQLRIVNTGGKTAQLSFSTHECCDFRVWDGSAMRWNYNNNRFFFQTPLLINVHPGPEHALELRSEPWHGTDNTGAVMPGQIHHFEAVLLLSGGPVTLGFDAELK
jgi:hypothetical protein